MTINSRAILPTLIAILSAGSAAAQSTADGTDVAQRIAVLEERVGRAEALRAVKRLQYAYGQYVEFGLWHDFADLFADDAVAHYQPQGLGKEEVRKLFLEQVGQGRLGLADGRLYPHFVLQPVVTLDPGGRTARGRWHLLTLLGGYGGNATWVGNVYENDYVLENGIWKIGELRTYTQFAGSYASGWTEPPARPAAAPTSGICENYLVNDCTIPFHYDAVRAGDPIGITVAAGPDGGAAATDPDGLNARAEAIDRRVSRLLDESEVRNLQHAYGYYFDRRLWDDVADLFAAGATFELGLRGVYRGRASIRRMLEQFGAEGPGEGDLDDHLQLETIVTVAPDGKTANARGVDFALWGNETDGDYRAEWREAVFVNTYVKENGAWKISSVHLYPRFATDYALGWAEDARPAPRASEAFPPDEPPTVVHGVYPEFYVPPFPFTNPVTGAPPQYPDGMPFPGDRVSSPAATGSPEVATPEVAAGRYAAAADSMAALSAHLDEIERRVAIAVAYDAVENVANAYNYALDEFDRKAAGDLFVVGGAVTVNNTEVADDRDEIRAAMAAGYAGGTGGRPTGFFAIHQTLQPVIHVADDGRSARIRFRLFEPAGRIGKEGVWIAGIYEAEAVVKDDVWKLNLVSINYTWAAEYSEGWAGAAPYAKIAEVPFHYDNPVSGRERPAGFTR